MASVDLRGHALDIICFSGTSRIIDFALTKTEDGVTGPLDLTGKTLTLLVRETAKASSTLVFSIPLTIAADPTTGEATLEIPSNADDETEGVRRYRHDIRLEPDDVVLYSGQIAFFDTPSR